MWHRLVQARGCTHTFVAKLSEASKSLAPSGYWRADFEHFSDPQARPLGCLRRQRIRLEEAAGNDLAVRLGHLVLPEFPDQVDRDMVPAGNVAVVEEPVQHRLPPEVDAPPPPPPPPP